MEQNSDKDIWLSQLKELEEEYLKQYPNQE